MKRTGDIIFTVGFGGFLFGTGGYDSNPVMGFVIGIIGICLAWTGYQMSMKKAPRTLTSEGAFEKRNT